MKPITPSGLGPIQGRLVDVGEFGGVGLAPRRVQIWTPSVDERNLDLLVMPDGQNLFVPENAHHPGKSWQIDEVADPLIGQGRCRPFAIVGVESTAARADELDLGEAGEAYLEMVVDDVIPAALDHLTVPTGRVVAMGSSMGGLVSLTSLARRPDVFSAAACLSPAVPRELVDHVAEWVWPTPVRLYIDNGGRDLDQLLQPGIDLLIGELAGRRDVDLRYQVFGDHTHDEHAWGSRAWIALEWIFSPLLG